jgi:DNA-binding CsgD family transcriptional regulator/tetratricopeptide (TPR) repeat protein
LAEETRPKLSGQYQRLWLDWLEGEYDNLRAALSWSLESGDIGSGLRIAIAIYEFWMIRDYAEEALGWIEQLLARADENVSPVVRANGLAYATFLTGFCGKSGAQAAYGRKAAELAKSLGAEGQRALAWATAGQAYSHGRPGPLPSGGSARAWALGAEAYSARAEGDYETELDIYKQLIHLHRQAGERSFLSFTLIKASFAAWSLGEHEEARAMVDEGLPLLRETGNPYQVAMTLNGSGDLARCEGDYTRARADYQESIALLREIGAVRDLASSLHNLGYTYLHLGNLERAHALFNESMRLQHTQQNTPGVAECLMGFGAMAVVCGIPAAGARLLAAAIAIGGERVTMTWAATRMEYERYLALIRTNLSEQEFRVEQASGRVLSLTQAVAYARKLPLRAAAQRTGKKLDDLTPREREVATLVGRALSNQEIAEELVVSKRTVETHISNIRSKLGFSKRAQMVRWALENGLVDAIE